MMTSKKGNDNYNGNGNSKATATAGPSIAELAKCASYFAQDDTVLRWSKKRLRQELAGRSLHSHPSQTREVWSTRSFVTEERKAAADPFRG
jgi:hypothetical protein